MARLGPRTPDGRRPGPRRQPAWRLGLALGATALALTSCGALPGATPAPSGATGPSRTPSPTAASPTSATSRTSSPAPTKPTATASSASPRPTATPGRPDASSCAGLAARLSLPERVGQLLMVSTSSTGLTSAQAAMVARTHAGSVLLLGNSTAGLAATRQVVADVRAAADRPQRVGLVLAADQEGGLVQRLSGPGFTDIPSASRQASLSDAALRSEAESWGSKLDAAGINVDLAPVADVVPRELERVNEPIGRLSRGYGPSPTVVAAKVSAFTQGMDEAGIGTAVKHFPGLGRVRGNTDTQVDVVDRTTTRDDAGLKGFAAGVRAGADMVMVSSATYVKIDPARQAAFSPTVVTGMIRGDLGFDGVVVSDDLAARGVSDVPAAQRVIRFVAAGGDLAIVADPTLAEASATALVQRTRTDPAFADRVDQSVARVLALKARRGLASC